MTGGAGSGRFEVVIVGARCAGAALARDLAAGGRSVLLVDAAGFPSDQVTSTHLIQPPGMDELDRLGVGDSVRKESPALRSVRLSYDGNEMRLPYPRPAHCLRRERLDALLQQVAVDAGAELRPECRVTDLIRASDGSVEGVVVRRRGKPAERIHADLVVGADGRNSTVAKLVGAEEYLGYDGPRAVYWAYWRRPRDWNQHEIVNTFEGRAARIVFPTDGDRIVIAAVPPLDWAREWRRDHVAAYLADVRSYREVGAYLGDDRPVSDVRGVFRPRYFFRVSAGPGWALLGDAGHHKEFVVGLGIAEALRDARALAAAIGERDERSIEAWWRRRDVERVEMFYWSQELGRDKEVTALQRLVAERLGTSPKLQRRFAEVLDGALRPYDFVPPSSVLKWVAGALLRGQPRVLSDFVEAGLGRTRARRELRLRRRLSRSLR